MNGMRSMRGLKSNNEHGMCKSSFLIIMVLLVTSCAGGNLTKPRVGSIVINGLVATNSTEAPAYDFLLRVEKVKEMVSVSPISE